MKLYSYWRSSTSYRLRIALNIKGVGYRIAPVNLLEGAHHDAAYVALNPGRNLPALVLDDGTVLTQSMAILEWLEARHRDPPLLPPGEEARAAVRAAALTIATDIHPPNNLKVLKKLSASGFDKAQIKGWMHEWMRSGFETFAALVDDNARFSFGDTPGLADICLVPQLYNAHRQGFDLARFARLTEIEQNCLALPAFEAARPENQPDARSVPS